MLASCPEFESDSTEDTWKLAGIDRHDALWDLLRGDNALCSLLDSDDALAVQQAAGYIKLHAPTLKDFRIEEETSIEVDGVTITAHPDLIDPPVVFDLKSRERYDYTPQMAAYGIAVMDSELMDWCDVHVLYTIPKFYARKLRLTYDRCIEIIRAILYQSKAARPCEFCGWCTKRVVCKALNKGVAIVSSNRQDWALPTYHSSQLTKPEDLAKAKVMAYYLRKWCDSVDHHATQAAVVQGMEIPGYHIQEGNDRSYPDLIAVFTKLGFTDKEFLGCCNMVMDRIYKVYAKRLGISENRAKTAVEKLLRPVMETKPTKKLVKDRKRKEVNE